ncbi:LysR family transcriptional regulator [Paraburkholderia sp. BCC1884]|uniref:LysR family transcriptional regulator n=1 Tax=Paraburkholderia sp. BCC1884 TaxID=2562668 RepID=UPI0021B4191F|nr:LysR family transcriptional regulator [Paraburkholderia sp. BCC1884]
MNGAPLIEVVCRLEQEERLKDVQTFRLYTRVARLGSFSAAARESGLAQSQVSRMIAELEAGLGARLLTRTTRAVVPTEAGLEFLARMEPILAAIDDAENSVRETGELRGVLRLAMPSTMAIRVIMPRLTAFTELHPLLRLDIMLDDRWQDMVREAVDVGIRVGSLPDSTGTARLIGKMHRVVVASPVYLARYGTPALPEELAAHRVVGGPAGAHVTSWQFERDGLTTSIDLQSHVSTNDTAGALAAAIAGLGIVSTTSWACQSELEVGALVQLLPEWKMAELPVHAYFPMGRTTRMAGRAFVEFIAAELKKEPPGRFSLT